MTLGKREWLLEGEVRLHKAVNFEACISLNLRASRFACSVSAGNVKAVRETKQHWSRILAGMELTEWRQS